MHPRFYSNAHVNFWTWLGCLVGLIVPDWLLPYAVTWCALSILWWTGTLLRNVMRQVAGFWAIPCLLALAFVGGCAGSDKATVYTEDGLRAAEGGWDAYYRAEASRCEKLHEPQTPEMEACFGATYDADAKVAKAVESAVGLLRAYWVARAAGEKPDIASVLRQVQELVQDLPPEAKKYFDRVRGLP